MPMEGLARLLGLLVKWEPILHGLVLLVLRWGGYIMNVWQLLALLLKWSPKIRQFIAEFGKLWAEGKRQEAIELARVKDREMAAGAAGNEAANLAGPRKS